MPSKAIESTVFSLFLLGTSNKYEKKHHKVTHCHTLAAMHDAVVGENKHIFDGADELGKTCEDIIEAARKTIDVQIEDNKKIINIVGYSRGAVEAIALTHFFATRPDLTFNLFLIDPVPGTFNIGGYDVRSTLGAWDVDHILKEPLPNNVRQCTILIHEDERTRGLRPCIPTVEHTCKYEVLRIPGHHASAMGNPNTQLGEEKFSGVDSLEILDIQHLVCAKMIQFLKQTVSFDFGNIKENSIVRTRSKSFDLTHSSEGFIDLYNTIEDKILAEFCQDIDEALTKGESFFIAKKLEIYNKIFANRKFYASFRENSYLDKPGMLGTFINIAGAVAGQIKLEEENKSRILHDGRKLDDVFPPYIGFVNAEHHVLALLDEHYKAEELSNAEEYAAREIAIKIAVAAAEQERRRRIILDLASNVSSNAIDKAVSTIAKEQVIALGEVERTRRMSLVQDDVATRPDIAQVVEFAELERERRIELQNEFRIEEQNLREKSIKIAIAAAEQERTRRILEETNRLKLIADAEQERIRRIEEQNMFINEERAAREASIQKVVAAAEQERTRRINEEGDRVKDIREERFRAEMDRRVFPLEEERTRRINEIAEALPIAREKYEQNKKMFRNKKITGLSLIIALGFLLVSLMNKHNALSKLVLNGTLVGEALISSFIWIVVPEILVAVLYGISLVALLDYRRSKTQDLKQEQDVISSIQKGAYREVFSKQSKDRSMLFSQLKTTVEEKNRVGDLDVEACSPHARIN